MILKTHRAAVLKLINPEQLAEAAVAHRAWVRQCEAQTPRGQKMHGSTSRNNASMGRALRWRGAVLKSLTAKLPCPVSAGAKHDPELFLAWRARCEAIGTAEAAELSKAYRKLRTSRKRSGLLFSQRGQA
jgi:hypothetical protein